MVAAPSQRIVLVRIQRAQLASPLASERVRAVVKYGRRGRSASCETDVALCQRQGLAEDVILPFRADFDCACAFLWDKDGEPLVRVQLVRCERTEVIASGELTVRLFGTEQELCLYSDSLPVGQISLRVDSPTLPSSDIQRAVAGPAENEPLEPLVDTSLKGGLVEGLEVKWAKGTCRWPAAHGLINMAVALGFA
mmetsp:Transcript_35055/g.81375  ORF Transcript_35055/g.81375 Transcript_35055/m.81375 type:complete len:195 (-) Transcript_35055:109-693(-)